VPQGNDKADDKDAAHEGSLKRPRRPGPLRRVPSGDRAQTTKNPALYDDRQRNRVIKRMSMEEAKIFARRYSRRLQFLPRHLRATAT